MGMSKERESLFPARQRELLPALGKIHERILGEEELCEALTEVMLAAGFLTEDASNPLGAAWAGDSPEWTI